MTAWWATRSRYGGGDESGLGPNDPVRAEGTGPIGSVFEFALKPEEFPLAAELEPADDRAGRLAAPGVRSGGEQVRPRHQPVPQPAVSFHSPVRVALSHPPTCAPTCAASRIRCPCPPSGKRPQVGGQPQAEPQQFEFDVHRDEQGRPRGGRRVPGADQPRKDVAAPTGQFGPEGRAVVPRELLHPPGQFQRECVAVGDDGEFGGHERRGRAGRSAEPTSPARPDRSFGRRRDRRLR